MPDYRPLWYWMREREAIRVKKEAGLPQPWSNDPILNSYRFCNVRREDDLVTKWIDQHIRKSYADNPNLWLMLCIARQINWPPTLQYLMDEGVWPTQYFDSEGISIVLNNWQAKGNKVYTGAYMISAPREKGANKNDYIIGEVIGELWRNKDSFPHNSMQATHSWLTEFKGWGPFMSYQAVVDMRFTSILGSASDIETWAAAGPGTIRGLNRVYGRALDYRLSQKQALTEMRDIYQKNETGIAIDFSDVPNICCETDKYMRVWYKEGRPRALYVAGRGS